jgi:hypothetical protein
MNLTQLAPNTTHDVGVLLDEYNHFDDEQEQEVILRAVTIPTGWGIGWANQNFMGSEVQVIGVITTTYELDKEEKLVKLIGKELFQALDQESRELLLNIVGALDFGVPIDIEETMNYSIYDD